MNYSWACRKFEVGRGCKMYFRITFLTKRESFYAPGGQISAYIVLYFYSSIETRLSPFLQVSESPNLRVSISPFLRMHFCFL